MHRSRTLDCLGIGRSEGDHEGRLDIHVLAISPTVSGATDHGHCRSIRPAAPLAASATIAAVLPFGPIAPLSRHARIGGPKRGCSTILRSHSGLLRAKKKAASSKNGTVGTIGRTMPKAAIKEGRVPDSWKDKPAKARQKDRDARWTVKYSKA